MNETQKPFCIARYPDLCAACSADEQARKNYEHIDDVIKKLMSDLGMPESKSLYLAFKQLQNEIAQLQSQAQQEPNFQARVKPWVMECFGAEISADSIERNHRFLEEALELVQSCGCTQSEAHQLVDYVFGRPVGEKNQEVGGVMVTLAALCLAQGLDMHEAGETELARIWTKVEQIRAKQAAKPKHSPLPQAQQEPYGYAVEDAYGDVKFFSKFDRPAENYAFQVKTRKLVPLYALPPAPEGGDK